MVPDALHHLRAESRRLFHRDVPQDHGRSICEYLLVNAASWEPPLVAASLNRVQVSLWAVPIGRSCRPALVLIREPMGSCHALVHSTFIDTVWHHFLEALLPRGASMSA